MTKSSICRNFLEIVLTPEDLVATGRVSALLAEKQKENQD